MEALPVVVPAFGLAVLLTCVHGCWTRKLLYTVNGLQTRVAQLESLPRFTTQPTSVFYGSPPTGSTFLPPPVALTPPRPSAPPAYTATYPYPGPRMV